MLPNIANVEILLTSTDIMTLEIIRVTYKLSNY